jgi:hypothetical protein
VAEIRFRSGLSGGIPQLLELGVVVVLLSTGSLRPTRFVCPSSSGTGYSGGGGSRGRGGYGGDSGGGGRCGASGGGNQQTWYALYLLFNVVSSAEYNFEMFVRALFKVEAPRVTAESSLRGMRMRSCYVKAFAL